MGRGLVGWARGAVHDRRIPAAIVGGAAGCALRRAGLGRDPRSLRIRATGTPAIPFGRATGDELWRPWDLGPPSQARLPGVAGRCRDPAKTASCSPSHRYGEAVSRCADTTATTVWTSPLGTVGSEAERSGFTAGTPAAWCCFPTAGSCISTTRMASTERIVPRGWCAICLTARRMVRSARKAW